MREQIACIQDEQIALRFLLLLLLSLYNRKVYQDPQRASRLCHCSTFQSGCLSHCVLCPRWADVRDDLFHPDKYLDSFGLVVSGIPALDNVSKHSLKVTMPSGEYPRALGKLRAQALGQPTRSVLTKLEIYPIHGAR